MRSFPGLQTARDSNKKPSVNGFEGIVPLAVFIGLFNGALPRFVGVAKACHVDAPFVSSRTPRKKDMI